MKEWMVVIDAVIQGAPEDAPRRRQTVNNYYATKCRSRVFQWMVYCGFIIIDSYRLLNVEQVIHLDWKKALTLLFRRVLS